MRWRQLVQCRHAIGARPLVANHRDEVTMQFAALERIKHFILSVEDDRRGFDAAMFGSDCGYLDHRATEIAGQQAQTTVGTERRRMSADRKSTRLNSRH